MKHYLINKIENIELKKFRRELAESKKRYCDCEDSVQYSRDNIGDSPAMQYRSAGCQHSSKRTHTHTFSTEEEGGGAH